MIQIHLLLILPFVNLLPLFHQHDYDVKLEIVEMTWYNPVYLKDAEVLLGWFNRTTRVINAHFYSMVTDATGLMIVNVQAYKFASNEYRFFPLRVELNMCNEYYRNNFGIYELLNRTSNIIKCPLLKGRYYVRNLVLDFSKFPPYIPRGQYKLIFQVLYSNIKMAEIAVFVTITDKPLEFNQTQIRG